MTPRDEIMAELLRFFDAWRTAWQTSEASRHTVVALPVGPDTTLGLRGYLLTCRVSRSAPFAGLSELWVLSAHGGISQHAFCPTWLVRPPLNGLEDEMGVDGALMPQVRDAIRRYRTSLISRLGAAAANNPADQWLVGQHVRFLVDQGDLDGALERTLTCAAAGWWCDSLEGYVRAARKELLQAEASFRRARVALSAAGGCEWDDLTELLDVAGRREYAGLGCSERTTLNERIWWLADPLYSEPGNERRVAHDVRRTSILLRSAASRDERFVWDHRAGGDALAEVMMRYGSPSYTYWWGDAADAFLPRLHASRESRARPAYTTLEYTRGRLHLLPSWAAIVAPFDAPSAAWEIADPERMRPVPEALLTGRAQVIREGNARRIISEPPLLAPADTAAFARMSWWPREHFRPSFQIVQLAQGQVVLLRRQKDALLAVASPLPTDGPWNEAHPAKAVLLVTRGPDNIATVAEGSSTPPLVRLRGRMSAQPALAAVEVRSSDGSGAARTRYGVRPAAGLDSLAPGATDISSPVLLEVSGDVSSLPSDPDSALSLMSGSMSVRTGGKAGVYWETYGIAPTETVEVSVRVARFTSQSLLRRLGVRLGVAADLNAPVSVEWLEQGRGRARVLEGPVPIVARSVILDTSSLPRGEYWLDVSVRPNGRRAVSSGVQLVVN